MNKNELQRKVSVFVNNVEYELNASAADTATKELVASVAKETRDMMQAIIDDL